MNDDTPSICHQCQRDMAGINRRKYCSHECYEIAMRPVRNEWRRNNAAYRKRQSDRQRVARHGINPDSFVQPESCDICGVKGETLAIDHDHTCCPGKYSCGSCVRGFLCNNCNNGLGRFKDDASLLHAAIEYLARATV